MNRGGLNNGSKYSFNIFECTGDRFAITLFSVQNQSGAGYFDALLDAEAGIKAVLSQHEIDEIIVIGGAGSYAEGDDMNNESMRSRS